MSSSGQSLARQTVRGIAWLLGSRILNQLLSLIIGVVLARLLSPSDYGLIGMALVFNGFLGVLSDFGMGTAVIQKQDLQEGQLSSIYWFNVGFGFLIAAIVIGISPIAAAFFEQPKLIPLMAVLSFNFVLGGFIVIPNALLQKAMRFETIAKIATVSALVAGCASITMALVGFGVWALVIQSLSTTLLTVIATWAVSSWRPKLHFLRTDLKSIFSFSLNLLGFQTLNYMARNSDYALIGHFLGPGPLGIYTLAYNIMLYPINNLTNVVSQAIFPAFASIQDETERLANAYVKTCRYLAFVIIPSMSGLAMLSREFILVVYGSKWIDSSPVLMFLSIVGTFQPFVSLAGILLIARGLTSWFLKWSLIVTPLMILSFIIGLNWGINGVAACYLIAQLLVTVIGMPIMFYITHVSPTKLLQNLAIPILATFVMLPVVWLSRHILLQATGWSTGGVLLVCVIAGMMVYASVLLLLRRYYLPEFLSDLHLLRNRPASI